MAINLLINQNLPQINGTNLMTTMYGIPNCDTIKKARKWLSEHNIDYDFHDYKKQGVPTDVIKIAIEALGLDTVVNKRGTTYRKLDDTIKSSLNEDNALALLNDHASMIKRPILKTSNGILIGFKAEQYEAHFGLK